MHALSDLRRRGFDLVVVEISPLPFADLGHSKRDAQALRFWKMWRESLVYKYERLDVATVQWTGVEPLASAIEEVRLFRRFARHAFA